MRLATLCGAALAATAIAGCRSDRAQPATETAAPPGPAPNPVTFTATDHKFDGPSSIPAGRTAVRLVNRGAEPHHLVVLRLEEGRTFDSLLAALKKPGPPPSWIRAVGGPNAAEPGEESNAEQVLTPGHYAVICFVPSPDGAPHMAKGMVNSLEVTPATGPAAAETPADVVVKLSDYDFGLSAPLSPGKHVVRVENTGGQLHEIVLAKLAPGRSAAELVAWELGGRKGEAPGTYVGGMAPMERGEQALFSATFEPGDYALICFVPDAKDGKPHTAHGMVKQIKVGQSVRR